MQHLSCGVEPLPRLAFQSEAKSAVSGTVTVVFLSGQEVKVDCRGDETVLVLKRKLVSQMESKEDPTKIKLTSYSDGAVGAALAVCLLSSCFPFPPPLT